MKLILSVLLLAAAPAFAENSPLPVFIKGKWGFVDRQGDVVIPVKYYHASPFQDGLARVGLGDAVNNNREMMKARGSLAKEEVVYLMGGAPSAVLRGVGFIDEKGAVVISSGTFDCVDDFKNGLALAYVDHKAGLIDKTGKWVIPAKFKDVGEFREGLAPAQNADEKWGYIDEKGEWVIPPSYYDVTLFDGGAAMASPSITKWLLIDKKDKTLFKLDDKVHITADLGVMRRYIPFPGGYERYIIRGKSPFSIRFIDRKGKTWGAVPQGKVFSAKPFRDGLSVAGGAGGWGLLDLKGEWAVAPSFDELRAPSEGLMAYRRGGSFNGTRHEGGRWGFADTAGKIVVKAAYDYVEDFRDGASLVVSDENPRWIDKTGEVIWSAFPVEPRAKMTAPPPDACRRLYDAARGGDSESVQELLEAGVDANCEHKSNVGSILRPLVGAAAGGNLEAVELLLKHGARNAVEAMGSAWEDTPKAKAVKERLRQAMTEGAR